MSLGLNFWQVDGYFGDNMTWSNFGTSDGSTLTGGHTSVEQETSTATGCPSADQGSSGQTVGQPWSYIRWQTNISDTYTRLWWGWFVPNYTGIIYLKTASDDSSLVYVSQQEFGQPTTDNNRTNVKDGVTLVVNNGGTHGRHYRDGEYPVTQNVPYYIRIYFGENGGGDNMIFLWNNNSSPNSSTSLTTQYTYLDGTQSNSVIFYTENPQSSSESSGLGIIASPLTSIDRGYNKNWTISVDKWNSYRSIGYISELDFSATQNANIIAGGGGFDGSFDNVDVLFRTQGDASSNSHSSGFQASKAFNNNISFVDNDYFKTTSLAYANNSIVSDKNAIKIDFLFPSPRTATEYRIYPPNEEENFNANYMPNRWCIYGSSYETIDTTKSSTEANGFFLIDSRADAKPWNAHDSSLTSTNYNYKTYRIANPGLYRQYRMSILQNSGNTDDVIIGELIYYEGGVGPLVGGGALDGRSDLSGGTALNGDVSGLIGGSNSFVTNIFDGSINSQYLSPLGIFNNNNLVSGKEFAIKFELPSKNKILKYDIKNTNFKSWTLRGCDVSSNYNRSNSNTYEVLDVKQDVSYTSTTISNIVANSKNYKYYVLDISNIYDNTIARIGELIYYNTGTYPSAGAGSLDGKSNREGGIKSHGDASGVGGEVPINIFNGTLLHASDSYTSNNGVFNNNSSGNNEFSVKFEFPNKKYITTYRIWPRIDNSASSPSDWFLYGCDVSSLYNRNDPNTYNVLDIRTAQNSWQSTNNRSIHNISHYNQYSLLNPGNYSYYVLDISGSNHRTSCSIGELAFYESNRVDVTTTRVPQPYEQHYLTINKGASQETSDWEIGEIIVFNKELSLEEENSVVSYLENTFYGVDGNDPVGNNRELVLPRYNLRLPEIFSAMDPSSRKIEYFNTNDYNNILDVSVTANINIADISTTQIKTSDLRGRLQSTDASFTNMFGNILGYNNSSIVKLGDFKNAVFGSGNGLGGGGGSGAGGIETTYSNYKVHSFTNTNDAFQFTVTNTITVDILIVGGGAGGYPGGSGAWEGGGGGAGELIFKKNLIMTEGDYTINVGAGGLSGSNGNITTITGGSLNNNNGYIANGGGTGTRGGGTAQNGGSGGGSGHQSTNSNKVGKARSGTAGIVHVTDSGDLGNPDRDRLDLSNPDIVNQEGHFAYSGGYKNSRSNIGGGGGGAGQHGALGTTISPGGDGKQYDIRTGSVEWYAGGGGGGARTNVNVPGGQGGGGYGASVSGSGPAAGGPGTANTGGGGGGSVHSDGNDIGGNGGSGILVIRYEI